MNVSLQPRRRPAPPAPQTTGKKWITHGQSGSLCYTFCMISLSTDGQTFAVVKAGGERTVLSGLYSVYFFGILYLVSARRGIHLTEADHGCWRNRTSIWCNGTELHSLIARCYTPSVLNTVIEYRINWCDISSFDKGNEMIFNPEFHNSNICKTRNTWAANSLQLNRHVKELENLIQQYVLRPTFPNSDHFSHYNGPIETTNGPMRPPMSR